MSNLIECPYCGYEQDMTDILCDGLDSSNNADVECYECGEYFNIYVEFEPIFYPSKIKYINCELCGIETSDFSEKNKKNICMSCYFKEILKEIER